MSGTPAPEQLVERVTALPGFTKAIGTRVLSAGAGSVHLAVDRGPDLLQFNGFFHGGVITGLADHAAGAAVTTALPAGRIAVTIDLSIHFLAPADGRTIVARARAERVGGTIGVASVRIMSRSEAGEKLCAIATVTLRIVDDPPALRADGVVGSPGEGGGGRAAQ